MPYNFSEEANMTNQKLAEELSKVSPLTADEVEKLLPKKVDKQRFNDLLTIVNSAAAQNKKVAALRDNIDALGSVLVKVLTKYLKPL